MIFSSNMVLADLAVDKSGTGVGSFDSPSHEFVDAYSIRKIQLRE